MNVTNKKRQLRQSNITECFSASNKSRKLELSAKPDSELSFAEDKMSSDMDNDFETRRELLACAAEKRQHSCSTASENIETVSKSQETPMEHTNGHNMAAACSTATVVTQAACDNNNTLLVDSDTNYGKTPPLFESDASCDSSDMTCKQLSLGTPISELRKNPECSAHLPSLKSTLCNHTVLFKVDSKFDHAPKPWPENYVDKWDEHYVRMPCSPKSVYPVDTSGDTQLKNRWDMIQTALSKNITSSEDLAEAILSYNACYAQKWKFDNLHDFFDKLGESERIQFFGTTLPKMISLVVKLPYLCTQPIPLLKQGAAHTVTISQLQVACLLANAFFCTFPRRNTQGRKTQGRTSEYHNYPDINFTNLFNGSIQRGKGRHRKMEKLKCLFSYFRRVTDKEPCGTVSFKRQYLTEFPSWKTSQKQFPRLHITSDGTIEDHGTGMLQVDFANKRIGGGVLNWGCVQEEIRFIICPELILSMLITEQMKENECVIITGCERYSCYSGYADNFEWTGTYVDTTSRDAWGRRYVEVVAIDAKSFRERNMQYTLELLEREINKAYCGFCCPDVPADKLAAVATGNWGCGVFRGDPYLKALLQLMAAAEAGREFAYFTFGNVQLCRDLHKMHTFLLERKITVGVLWSILVDYQSKCITGLKHKINLYEFVYRTIEQYDGDTDVDASPPAL